MISECLKFANRKQLATPIDLILHVNTQCNAKCATCYNWSRLNSTETDLSLDEYRALSKQLPDLIFLSLSGGEPFLRKDLPEVCDTFIQNSKPSLLGIPTNGLLPEKIEHDCREILKRSDMPLNIDLSLDGLYEGHDDIRGVRGNFGKVMETFERLKALKSEHSRLLIKVITVVNNKNFDALEDIDEYVRSHMKEVNFHSFVFLRGDSPGPGIALPAREDLEKKREFFTRRNRHYRGNGELSWIEKKLALAARQYLFDINMKALERKTQVIPCLAGSHHGVIYSNGDVAFCETQYIIGNIKDYGMKFDELWHSEKANRYRAMVRNKECHCTHECAQQTSILFNTDNYLPALNAALKRPT